MTKMSNFDCFKSSDISPMFFIFFSSSKECLLLRFRLIPYPTAKGGSSVGIRKHCVHVFARFGADSACSVGAY